MIKKIEIFLKKIFLKILLIGNPKSNNNQLVKFDSNSKILFIRLNRIGDALVSTPLLQIIKKNLKCKTIVLASASNYFVFQNNELCDKLIVFQKSLKNFVKLIHRLNSEDLTAVVDLHDDISTTVSFILALLKAPIKIGFKKGNESLYTHLVVKLDTQKHHIIDRLMEFAKFFNVKTNSSDINVYYKPDQKSLQSAKAFLKKSFAKQKFLLGINISAGSQARFWGIRKYKELINSLIKYDLNILILCQKSDLAKAKEISNNYLPIFYSDNFDEFAAMISQLNLLFTPDTSIVHVASSFKIPMFGLYVKYNTEDVIWYPYKSDYECIITKEPTLKNISSEKVIQKLIPFLEKYLYDETTTRV
ncbi:glycosyltransferase family 9 protein [Melioribacteraceae bacterium 4301-Me]|uniref:glycosyltransferase family 9 protein n=1 Tax=Pyranulibacter aquaticus TaxID=3163344 RepID=UPI0035964D7F